MWEWKFIFCVTFLKMVMDETGSQTICCWFYYFIDVITSSWHLTFRVSSSSEVIWLFVCLKFTRIQKKSYHRVKQDDMLVLRKDCTGWNKIINSKRSKMAGNKRQLVKIPNICYKIPVITVHLEIGHCAKTLKFRIFLGP